MGFSERCYTSQDGLTLYFRDYGREHRVKTPVLCLAGLTRNSNDFSRLAEQLSSDRRVICPDYRGRGKSDYDSNWRNYTSFTYMNDIRHLLSSLNLCRVFVIGTSMGGLMAMGMGAAMPTTLAGALINDVGPVIEKSISTGGPCRNDVRFRTEARTSGNSARISRTSSIFSS